MIEPNRNEAQLIDQGTGTPGRNALLSWFDAILGDLREDLVTCDEEKHLRILQGRALMMTELTRRLRDGVGGTGRGVQPTTWTPDP